DLRRARPAGGRPAPGALPRRAAHPARGDAAARCGGRVAGALRRARRRRAAAHAGAGLVSGPPPVPAVADEEPARRLLAELLAAEPGVSLAGECRNGFEAVQAIQTLAPDLVLLDVQMPKLDGFEVLELLPREDEGRRPLVVFVTAYDQYAVRAFE